MQKKNIKNKKYKKNKFINIKKKQKTNKNKIKNKKYIYNKKIKNIKKKNKNKKKKITKKNKTIKKKKIIKKNKINEIKNNIEHLELKKKNILKKIKNKKKIIYKRPPIITIMGHVNHGKTSLIEIIKKINLKKNEKGNITQYIKGYYIKNKNIEMTILDTPGHEIFFKMRKRSINITDIILLIISIDDGIKPQTKEIIKYIKKNKIPVIIIINKIDKKNYLNNIKKIKEYIYKKKLVNEKINNIIEISIKKKINIDKLIKKIKKISKYLKLNTNINKPSEGIILESKINKKKGIIINVIIKNGKMKKGDIIICKNIIGKVKSIYNDNKKEIKYALPSMPIEILGFKKVISPGNKIISINNFKIAKKIIEIKNKQYSIIKKNKKYKKKEIFSFENKNNKKNIIIKTDVYGSIDAIKSWIKKKTFNNINIIYYNIGNINETDLMLAKTSKSIILSFNVNINNLAKKKNIKLNIKIYYFEIIYKLFDKLKKINKIKTNEKKIHKIIGKAIIKNIFNLKKNNYIIGCKVISGIIKKKNYIQIIRNNEIIYYGKIKSLKKYKKDIEETKKNTECGIKIKTNKYIKIKDILQCIENIKKNEENYKI